MQEFFTTLVASLEEFLSPHQTIYDYLVARIPETGYIFGGLAILGTLLVLVGALALSSTGYENIARFLDTVQAAPRLVGFILLLIVCVVTALISGDKILSGLFQAVLIVGTVFGYTISKMSVLLGSYRIGIWGVRNMLKVLLAFGIGYVASSYLNSFPWVPFIISILFLTVICLEVYAFALDANFNKGLALGQAILAGIGGIYEAKFSLAQLGGIWIWVSGILKFIFLIGFTAGFVREYLRR